MPLYMRGEIGQVCFASFERLNTTIEKAGALSWQTHTRLRAGNTDAQDASSAHSIQPLR
jgi:hypothetical protein